MKILLLVSGSSEVLALSHWIDYGIQTYTKVEFELFCFDLFDFHYLRTQKINSGT